MIVPSNHVIIKLLNNKKKKINSAIMITSFFFSDSWIIENVTKDIEDITHRKSRQIDCISVNK